MPGHEFLDLLELLGKEYDPDRPPAEPKPPGYWFTRSLARDPLPFAIGGGVLGGLGSALRALTEQTAGRVGSVAGNIASGLPEQVTQDWENADLVPTLRSGPLAGTELLGGPSIQRLVMRALGRTANEARGRNVPPWGDPDVFMKAQEKEGVHPLETVLSTMVFDPTLPLQLGKAPFVAAQRSIPKYGQAALPGFEELSGLVSSAPKTEKALEAIGKAAELYNLPFQKTAEVGTNLVSGLGGLIRKFPKGQAALEQAPESQAAEAARSMYDITKNVPEYFAGLRYPLQQIGRYVIPEMKSGLPDLKKAKELIEAEHTALETAALKEVDPQLSVRNMQLLFLAKTSIVELEERLVSSFKKDFYGTPQERADAIGAYRAWYDSTRRIIDTVKESMLSSGGLLEDSVPNVDAVQLLLKEFLHEWGEVIRDTKRWVADITTWAEATKTPKSEWFDMRADLYHARNLRGIELFRELNGRLEELTGIVPDQAVNEEYLNRLKSLEQTAMGGPSGSGFLPEQLKGVMNQMWDAWAPQVVKIQGDQYKLAKELGDALRLPPTNKSGVPWSLGELWDELGGVLETAGDTPIGKLGETSSTELMNALGSLSVKGLTNPQAVNNIRNVLARWENRGDLLLGDPLGMAIGPTQDVLETSLRGAGGLQKAPEALQAVGRTKDFIARYIKEGWLASTSYLGANFITALGMNLFENPATFAKTFSNFKQLTTNYRYGMRNPGLIDDINLYPSEWASDLSAVGRRALPSGVGTGYITANMQGLRDAGTATERMPWLGRAALGLVTAPADPIGVAMSVGFEVAGKPALIRLTKGLAQLTESAARGTIVMHIAMKRIEAQAAPYLSDLMNAMRGANLGQDEALLGLANQLRRTNGRFSPEDIRESLIGLGVTQDEAVRWGQQWANIVQDGMDAGSAVAFKRHINYGNFTNIEQAIDEVVPFARWAIRMVPNFRDILAQSPAFVVGINRWNSITSDRAEELGLPDSMNRAISTGRGLGTAIAEAMIGREVGDVNIDPTRFLMPFAQYGAGFERAKFAEGPVAGAVQSSPLQPYPHWQVPVQAISGVLSAANPEMAGVLPYGSEAPLSNISRFSGLAQLAGGPSEELWQLVYKALGKKAGLDPFSFEQYDVSRAIGEEAARQTGYPDHPLYQAARRTLTDQRLGGTRAAEIAQEVQGRVRRERGLEQLGGMILPATTRILRKEEMEAYKAKRQLPTGRKDTLEKQEAYQEALAKNPAAAMHQGASGTDLDAKIQYVFNVFSNPALLFADMHPDVATQLSRQLKKYEAIEGTPGAKTMLRLDPLLGLALQRRAQFQMGEGDDELSGIAKAYIYWKQNVHPRKRKEGEKNMAELFSEWYKATGGR